MAWLYSFMEAGMWSGGFIYTAWFVGPAFVGGADMALGAFLAYIGSIPVILCFAFMSASMPRAGGDYVWMSRVLHPSIGFVLPNVAITIFQIGWLSANGYLIVNFIASAFYWGGAPLSLQAFFTPTVQVAIIIISIIVAGLVIAAGMRFIGRWILRPIGALTLCSVAFFLFTMAINSNADFIQAYNHFVGPNAYQLTIDRAQETGWKFIPITGFGTALFMAQVAPQYLQSIFPVAHLGEIKGAEKVRNTTVILLGGLTTVAIMTIALAYFTQVTFGREFWGSLAWLFFTGQGTPQTIPYAGTSVVPYFAYLGALMAPFSIVVVAIFGVSLILHAGVFYQMLNMLNNVKYVFAAAFDSIIPRKCAYVDPRTKAPLVALIILIAGGFVWLFATLANPAFIIYRAIASIGFAQFIYYGGTCVAAILFPYRAKAIYAASPIAKYKVGSVPAIVILGILGAFWNVFLFFWYGWRPELGAINIPSIELVTAIYLITFVFYFACKYIRKAQGIDISLAFKQLPPE